MSGRRSEIQFVFSSYPGLPGTTSAETQRQVHSHAAGVAHAKARRQRVAKYQALKASSNSKRKGQQYTKAVAEVEIATISSPTSHLGSGRRDPFASFARHLNPIEDFLLDYYMRVVIPCSNLPRDKLNDLGSCPRHLNRQFAQIAATNASSLDGLFLVASRHVSQSLPHQAPYYIQLALEYKIACARSLMEAISSLDMQSLISDSTVTLALFLAQDEVLVGDTILTKRHMQGAIQMVRHNCVLKRIDFGAFPYDLILGDMGSKL